MSYIDNNNDPVGKFWRAYEEMNAMSYGELLLLVSRGRMSRKELLDDNGNFRVMEALRRIQDFRACWNATGVSPDDIIAKNLPLCEAVEEYAEASGLDSYVDTYMKGVSIEDICA